jgi:hypothetical protein
VPLVRHSGPPNIGGAVIGAVRCRPPQVAVTSAARRPAFGSMPADIDDAQMSAWLRAISSAVSGQATGYPDIDCDEWVAGAVAGGVPVEYGAAVLSMLTETIAAGRGSRPSNDTEKATGAAPVSFADFARRAAASRAMDETR